MRTFVVAMIVISTVGLVPTLPRAGAAGTADPAASSPGQIVCPKCRKGFAVGRDGCPHCGHKQQVTCPNPRCRKPFTYGLQQCPHCNARIRYKTKPASKTGAEKSHSPKKPEDSADGTAEKAASRPAARPQSAAFKKAVRKLAAYYTELYAEHLKSRDWFVRALAIVALARIDDELTTAKILEVLRTDRSPLVKLYAWEALHTRVKTLTDEQYGAWVDEGLRAMNTGGFPGDFRAPLVRALAHRGPTPVNVNAIIRLLSKTAHTDPADSRTLTAMRDTVAAWHDPKLARLLIARMGKGGGEANRAEYLLGGLESGVAPVGSVSAPTPMKTWTRVRGEWFRWLKDAGLAAAKPGAVPRYAGGSRLIPSPGLIDPRDPKWREDLEIGTLRVSAFDLVFCIDSTSSMLPVMQWVGREVIRMLGAFELVSREPRIGVTLFRHEVDPKVMQKCCRAVDPKQVYAMQVPDGRGGMRLMKFRDYRTKNFPLTGRVGDLAGWLNKEKAAGAHHSHLPDGLMSAGASYGGLCAALAGHPWVKANHAKKVVVILGDSPYTAMTDTPAVAAATEAARRGFIIHTIKVLMPNVKLTPQQKKIATGRGFLPGFYKVAEAGGGTCMTVIFNRDNPAATAAAGGQIAEPLEQSSPFHRIVGEIIRSTIPEDYHKRVDPLVNVLLEYTSYPPKRRARR